MKINIQKTKRMKISVEKEIYRKLTKQFEQVESFKYSVIECKGKTELNDKLGTTGRIFNNSRTTFLGRTEIVKPCRSTEKIVRPTITFSSET